MFQPLADLKDLQILVVEQDLDTRLLYTMTLESAGAKVWATASVEAALAVLAHDYPDVIMTSLRFSHADGYVLMRQVRALQAVSDHRIPAIAVSAYSQEEQQARALAAGFQRYLAKPVDPFELTQTLLQVAQGRSERQLEGQGFPINGEDSSGL